MSQLPPVVLLHRDMRSLTSLTDPKKRSALVVTGLRGLVCVLSCGWFPGAHVLSPFPPWFTVLCLPFLSVCWPRPFVSPKTKVQWQEGQLWSWHGQMARQMDRDRGNEGADTRSLSGHTGLSCKQTPSAWSAPFLPSLSAGSSRGPQPSPRGSAVLQSWEALSSTSQGRSPAVGPCALGLAPFLTRSPQCHPPQT